jgi:hypothetical protein
MEKSGCAIIVAIGIGVVFIAGLWLGRVGNGGAGEDVLAGTPFAQIGNTRLTLGQLDSLERLSTDERIRNAGPEGNFVLGPREQSGILAGAIFDLVNYAIQIELARRQGADLSDQSVVGIVGSDAVSRMEAQHRAQLEAQGKLQPGASRADLEAAIKAANLPAPEVVRERQDERIRELLADPNTRILAQGFAAGTFLRNSIRGGVNPSDEQLKRWASTIVAQRVLLPHTPATRTEVRARADAVLKEIRGGLDFKRAIARYSKDTPNPGKSLAESVTRLPVQFLGMMPGLEPLKDMQAGQVSEVLDMFEGYAIYRVQAIEPPQDFARMRASIRSSYIEQETQRQFDEMIAMERPNAVKGIKSEGFRALLNIQLAILDHGARTDWQKLYDEATAALAAGDALGTRAAMFARMESHARLWAGLTEAQRAERREERIEVLTETLQHAESVAMRLELVVLLKQLESPEAGRQLLAAAMANNQPTPVGQQHFSDIAARLITLREARLIDAETTKQVEVEQRRWAEDKRLFDEEQERFRREEEEARRQAEAELKAEEARAKAEAAKVQPEARPRDEAGQGKTAPRTPAAPDPAAQGKN